MEDASGGTARDELEDEQALADGAAEVHDDNPGDDDGELSCCCLGGEAGLFGVCCT